MVTITEVSEYIRACNIAHEIQWLRNSTSELTAQSTSAIPLCVHNQGALSSIKETVPTQLEVYRHHVPLHSILGATRMYSHAILLTTILQAGIHTKVLATRR